MAEMDNSTKRRGLGRGLGALIVDTQSTPPAEPQVVQGAGIRDLSLDAIAPNPQQPRTRFDPEALAELASSIREHGIIQPLIVTRNPHQVGSYWLIAGERRWRAARLAGHTTAPAIVRDASSQQLVEWALVENLQRADLNPLEEATAYQVLLNEFSLSQAEIGQRVGKSRSAVANTVRLLNLPADAQSALVDGRITAGHARALLALPDPAAIGDALARVLAKELTVRQTEELVRQMAQAAAPAVDPAPVEEPEDEEARRQVSHLENRFRSALGTKVNLTRNRDGSGRLVVHFYNDDDLNHLFQTIAGEDE